MQAFGISKLPIQRTRALAGMFPKAIWLLVIWVFWS